MWLPNYSKNRDNLYLCFSYVKYRSNHLYYSYLLNILVYMFNLNFIAMKNFELKKYFGNLVGMPTTMKQPASKPLL